MPSKAEEIRVDVAIVGAGPVGLFAVFECGMLGLSCAVIDALEAAGGQCAALYPEKPIYDIPGYPVIEAAELIHQLEAQAAPFHPTYHLGQQVERLTATDGGWLVETAAGTRRHRRGRRRRLRPQPAAARRHRAPRGTQRVLLRQAPHRLRRQARGHR